MKLIRPKALRAGKTLGIITCSTPVSAASCDTIQRTYDFLQKKGFHLIEASNCRKTIGHSAGTIAERVAALHAFFTDPEVVGILSYWGGYQSHQLLEYLDYDLIRKNPKPLIGYSDTTALQIGIYVKTGLATFSGPAGITFGKPVVPELTWANFEKVLINPKVPFHLSFSREFSDNPWYREPEKKMIFQPNPGWKVYRHGRAEGTIIAGNLGTLLLLAGTQFWPKLKGAILFIEDDEVESPKTIDRMFTQMRQMGVYAKIAGMVVGRFSGQVGFSEDDSLEMILNDALKGYQFPVITGIDYGHTDPLLTIPLGVRCRINTSQLEIAYLESAVA